MVDIHLCPAMVDGGGLCGWAALKGRKAPVGATPLYGASPHAVGNIEHSTLRRQSSFASATEDGGYAGQALNAQPSTGSVSAARATAAFGGK